jgi:hypothetical protein
VDTRGTDAFLNKLGLPMYVEAAVSLSLGQLCEMNSDELTSRLTVSNRTHVDVIVSALHYARQIV